MSRPYDGPLDAGLAAVAAADAAAARTAPTADPAAQWGRRVRITLDMGTRSTPPPTGGRAFTGPIEVAVDAPTESILIADHYPDRDDGLHVSVETDLNLTLTPQPCRVDVWGLSAERRALLTAKQRTAMNTAWKTRTGRRIGRIRVEAGRAGAFGVTFVGVIMKIEHALDGADWRTTITAQDGRLEWANARVTESVVPGIDLADFEAVLRASEEVLLGKQPFEAFAGQYEKLTELKAVNGYEQGFALMGNSIENNMRLCDALHLEPFWTQGRFIYVPRGRSTNDPAVRLVRGSSLHAETEVERGYRQAQALLNHLHTPGRQVQLVEEDGRPIGARAYRIESVKRTFSSWDNAWNDALYLRPTTPLPDA